MEQNKSIGTIKSIFKTALKKLIGIGTVVYDKSRNIVRDYLFSPLYFVITFLFIEIVFHIAEFKNISLTFPMLFSIPAGILFGLICDAVPEKIGVILRYVLSALVMLLFGTQIVYFYSFQSFMSLSQLGMGDDVFQNFLKSILLAVWKSLPWLILIFLPLALLILMQFYYQPNRKWNWKRTLITAGCLAVSHFLVVLALPLAGSGAHTPYDNYHKNWVLDLSVEKLGLITTTRLDLKYYLLGDSALGGDEDVPVIVTLPVDDETTVNTESVDSDGQSDTTDTVIDEPKNPYNTIEGLDFSKLAETEKNATAKKVLEYLASLEPTKKNEYTGMFKGYNLIMMCAESMSAVAVDKDVTPTLYEIANSGFVFDNYWSTFPNNTTNGEYTFLTGLLPDISKPKKNGSFIFTYDKNILMNMNIGRYFNGMGLVTRAYHNHTAQYYSRYLTHPRLGYVYKGKSDIGGLKGWPESDLIMVQRTLGEYINDDIFHAYYMTVSGHKEYLFGGYNSIADKNADLVQNLNLGNMGKAYMACHIELDKALEYLIDELGKAGKLDNTVICIAPDHYPYGLTDAAYKVLLGHSPAYGGLEKQKSTLILWNSKMGTVHVDKPCCSADILPTLLNLFGFEYDSRLYSGTDILSDSYGLAMISNQSFITDKIVYNSSKEKVYKLDSDWTVPNGYLEAYIQIVKNRFSIASNILNYNIYKKLPEDIINAAQIVPVQTNTSTDEALIPDTTVAVQ